MKHHPHHHGDPRAALLELAEQTAREYGHGQLSPQSLAREARVSPGAPSRHFGSKQALLDALALAGLERLTTALTDALGRAREGFGERLSALARPYVSFATANTALLDLMHSRKHDPAAGAELEEARRRGARRQSRAARPPAGGHDPRPDRTGVKDWDQNELAGMFGMGCVRSR